MIHTLNLLYLIHLSITQLTSAQPLKTAHLKPSSISTLSGISVTTGPGVSTINDKWNINVVTQQGSDLSISLNEEWSFHPTLPSSIQLYIQGSTSNTSYDQDGEIVFVFSVNNQYFAQVISLDKRKTAYKECPNSMDPLITRDINNMITSLIPDRYHRFCKNPSGTAINDGIDYWNNVGSFYRQPAKWPMWLTIMNNPILNTISYTWTDSITGINKVTSQYTSSFPSNQAINMYISGESPFENFFIFSIDVTYRYYTPEPTNYPTPTPTNNPTFSPTTNPTNFPSKSPTKYPSKYPTDTPSNNPTYTPSKFPTNNPTYKPTTNPSNMPSISPTYSPIKPPTINPTLIPTNYPTISPTFVPTPVPTPSPTALPTPSPTIIPTNYPTISPSNNPTITPTYNPSNNPSITPTNYPSIIPTNNPTIIPTTNPIYSPTNSPTIRPTVYPTVTPTMYPTITPSDNPTPNPTPKPTPIPSPFPTAPPSLIPSMEPSLYPSNIPSKSPSTYSTNTPSVTYMSYKPTDNPIKYTPYKPEDNPIRYTPTDNPSTTAPTISPINVIHSSTNMSYNTSINVTIWPIETTDIIIEERIKDIRIFNQKKQKDHTITWFHTIVIICAVFIFFIGLVVIFSFSYATRATNHEEFLGYDDSVQGEKSETLTPYKSQSPMIHHPIPQLLLNGKNKVYEGNSRKTSWTSNTITPHEIIHLDFDELDINTNMNTETDTTDTDGDLLYQPGNKVTKRKKEASIDSIDI